MTSEALRAPTSPPDTGRPTPQPRNPFSGGCGEDLLSQRRFTPALYSLALSGALASPGARGSPSAAYRSVANLI